MGTVTIYRTYFLEDEIFEGDIPRDDVSTEVREDLTAREAADLLIAEGLSFAATGSEWAADPDGSHVTNYRTGERVETSGHLSGFHPRVVSAIIEKVG